MTQAELFALLERFEKSNIAELSYRKADERITLRKQGALPQACTPMAQSASTLPHNTPSAAVQSKTQEPQGKQICAPLVGTFYSSPAPGEPPFAVVGKELKKGDTVCIIEAMKMINEVPAPCDCVIKEVLIGNETLVGFGQPLFIIEEK